MVAQIMTTDQSHSKVYDQSILRKNPADASGLFNIKHALKYMLTEDYASSSPFRSLSLWFRNLFDGGYYSSHSNNDPATDNS